MSRASFRFLYFLYILNLIYFVAACRQPPQSKITIGSKFFTEQVVLAELLAQHIEARTGIPVIRKTNLGGTLLVHKALLAGELDLYVEYTGTARPLSSTNLREETRTRFTTASSSSTPIASTWKSPSPSGLKTLLRWLSAETTRKNFICKKSRTLRLSPPSGEPESATNSSSAPMDFLGSPRTMTSISADLPK